MKFKLFWLIFILVLAVLIYFAYPIIKNRYFESASKKIEFAPQAENIPENANGIEDQAAAPVNEPAKDIDAAGTLPNISAKDCDNECQNFKDAARDLIYCQEVCGLATAKNDVTCEKKTGLEKDYCLKDLAIAKKDSSLCGEIKDANIKLTCQNRIVQDILEGQ